MVVGDARSEGAFFSYFAGNTVIWWWPNFLPFSSRIADGRDCGYLRKHTCGSYDFVYHGNIDEFNVAMSFEDFFNVGTSYGKREVIYEASMEGLG